MHAQIQEFSSEGVQVFLFFWGGGFLLFFFFIFFFLFFLFSPQLILQKSNGQFQRNLSFFKVLEGSNIFSRGGGPTFSRGGPIAYSL